MEEKIITFDDIQKANETIKTTDIKGKDYAEVNQRIKAFRMVYPSGVIKTEMKSNNDGVCIFEASIYEYYIQEPNSFLSSTVKSKLLATGTAYEKENSTFINKTSYIENCETSAVGRALGMCGFGIDTSIASAEEVQNAIKNQELPKTKEEAENLILNFGKYNGKSLKEIMQINDTYLDWLLNNDTTDEYIKECVILISGKTKFDENEVLPIQETQKQRIKEIDKTLIKEFLKKCNVSKISELTFEQANELLEEN